MTRRTALGLGILCLTLAVTACSGGLEADKREASRRIETYLAARPDLDAGTASEMRAFRLRNGMTEEQVRATWGAPDDVLELSEEAIEWRFSCAFPHLCRGRTGARQRSVTIKPNAFFVNGKLERWNY